MIRAVADTHAVIWHLYADERLSEKAKKAIEQAAKQGDQIGFSAITLIEMVYLVEKGRIDPNALDRLLAAMETGNSVLVEIPVTGEVAREMRQVSRESIPDMPDRIIAATAQTIKVPIISRDGKIKVSGLKTIW
ncbi:MAG: PIN domain-containing protein [Chloroflexi bacterium]|nr:MAG: PIN domain-containing protein [Chloroflexota bacterium]